MNHPLTSTTPTQPESTPDDDPVYFNSEFILFVGLFIVLCFLICLIALNAAARCTWTWFSNIAVTTNRIDDHFSLHATKLLRTIPKLTYSASETFSDCVICLTEFVVGDEVRVLPRCGHCFHVACIDRWIGSHFTCPSCRQRLLKNNRCDEVRVPVAGIESGETSVVNHMFIT
ncbi:hypothetical protein QVD17_24165 [Tagetes erecta]|uniref:RING-type domain-containing protein n=1 Tax=Tagetes erecta TaxID=13708 RepID=A0AAD8KJW5_TARER|nr:hypothetical protein QVD17_24165 [Tagetes erecta]